jgi:RNA:NAD 2'-phosphotransferase (TPT1/KptA family)
MKVYHGTTSERLRSIQANGLRKGTYVSPDRNVAEHFAQSRANWNGERPIVLTLNNAVISRVITDRSGRQEAQLLEVK